MHLEIQMKKILLLLQKIKVLIARLMVLLMNLFSKTKVGLVRVKKMPLMH